MHLSLLIINQKVFDCHLVCDECILTCVLHQHKSQDTTTKESLRFVLLCLLYLYPLLHKNAQVQTAT